MKLDWLSKKIGLNVGYFLSQGVWVGGRFFAVSVITLLISVAFARLTDKETYGQYQYVISLASIFSIFSLPGLNTAALRGFLEGDEHAVPRSVRYSFFLSHIATLLMVGFGVFNYFQNRPLLGIGIGIAGILLPYFYGPNNWYIFYEGKLNFRSSTIRLIIANIFQFIGLLLGLKFKLNVVGLLLIYFGVNAIFTTYFYLEGKKTILSPIGESKLSLNFAVRCTIQKFTGSIGENIQALAISSVFGFSLLAVYQVAQSFVNTFLGLTNALSSTYFPLLLKYKKLNHWLIILQHFVLGLLMLGVYFLVLRFLFVPLYGAKYQDSVDLARQVGWVVVLLPLRVYFTNFFTVKDRNAIVIITNLTASFIALAVFILLKTRGFNYAATSYLYILNLLLIIPLWIIYLFSIRKPPA